MKRTTLKTGIASAALVVALATATACGTNEPSAGAGERPQTGHGEQTGGSEQNTPAPIGADGPDVFPHSLDFDPPSQTFFVGSLGQGRVFAVDQDGTVRTFIDDPELISAQSVLVDAERDRVLVSNVDYGTAERSRETPFTIAGVGSYDLATGEQHWCVDLTGITLDGKQHLIADVTVAPDGTAYAVDQLTPTVFRIDPDGDASVFLADDQLRGELDIPDFLDGVGMSAVDWVEGDQLIISMADGSLVRVPLDHPEDARKVELSAPLAAPTAGLTVLEDGSILAVSSGLLTGDPARIQRVEPSGDDWTEAEVSVTDIVEDPVTSDVTPGPNGSTYALSGGLAELLAGLPNEGFTLTPVMTD